MWLVIVLHPPGCPYYRLLSADLQLRLGALAHASMAVRYRSAF